MQIQSNRQAMHYTGEYSKGKQLPGWIKRGQHLYPSTELSHIEEISSLAQAAFRGRLPLSPAIKSEEQDDLDFQQLNLTGTFH